ncbi:TIGR04211 family SH3 domain-containing protein [Marinobacter psychrophilus]|uniref:TIGR04211 family SH3 domain-containing protein n=1 Tax=Marinobacter psychrophilus TaxID=330734 RepID=UPI001B488137|nr:TIGR04211 family SH3 domain-containing protein [Marinobacter psychrophilus]MBQ0764488.1 TIGR04211 family SH3 domain-containing protein [Marinobacter psychrophilus]MBQ0846339.1 TIGR04211 family SH3 domain-containing protein [Marinobacter psychrophilus]
MTPFRLLVVLFFVFSSIATAQARTVWVDDKIYLPVRSGAGSQFRIIENAVPSGTAMELLESDQNGYSKVRTTKGTEGWVSSQHLSSTPIAATQLKKARQDLEAAQAEVRQVQDILASVTGERDSLQNSESGLADRSSELMAELKRIKDIAANSINLERRNGELLEENQKIHNELEILTAENERMEAGKESDFMLLGAGLVLGGVLLALLVPMLKPTRKSDNWA